MYLWLGNGELKKLEQGANSREVTVGRGTNEYLERQNGRGAA